ncbi:MAG: MSHA biogenesis protein MshP [Pseudomonadota bacterium]
MKPTHRSRRSQRGLGAVAAIVVLVVLATIAAAVVRLSTSQQAGIAQELQAARASQAAQAGIEWGLYQALRSGSCGSSTLDLTADLGMSVAVSCAAAAYNEGLTDAGANRSITVYTIDAVACNSASCPDAARAVTPHYVERRRQVSATDG